MSAIDKHVPGSFCWPELGTTDPAAAKIFYSQLFGWTTEDLPMGEGITYTLLKLEGRELGALYELPPELRRRKVPPHWLLYVSVESADQAAERTKQLGGNVLAGPADVPHAGRYTVLQDRQGAVFGVWQPGNHIGARIGGVYGTLTWSELLTTDTESAKAFYDGLFGWGAKTDSMGHYTEWMNQGRPIGGMMQIRPEWKGVPPHWMPYFLVADCDATAATAKELGGGITVPPSTCPTWAVSRF
jgi:hypothetical protein